MRPAVPQYVTRVTRDFGDAPPGHRFGLYFAVWSADWSVLKEKKSDALRQTLKLPEGSVQQLEALGRRQEHIFAGCSEESRLAVTAISTSPLATGLGIEHPLENGFAFLNPYGLAYLPGSSIKGVLKRAAKELASELLESDRHGWTPDCIDGLFGPEVNDGDAAAPRNRGALIFWDCIPRPADDSLGMDVMTPHYGDYYQGKSTPHDAGQPNPIVFLVVPPGSRFGFHVTCDTHRLSQELRTAWKRLTQGAFLYAFDWLGFGAKTAVGYGAMRLLEKGDADSTRSAAQAEISKCEWVDQTIAQLARERNEKPQVILRGRLLAEAWQRIEDAALKQRALDDIRGRWQREGWWDNPPGKAAKQAKTIYAPGSA
jgi:CRISPR-associated protein Cmr6